MADGRGDERSQRDSTGTAMKRRGILRAAGTALSVVLTGIAMKQAAQPVAAATQDANFVSTGGGIFTFGFGTQGGNAYGFYTGDNLHTTGVYGWGSSQGVQGTSSGGTGVSGTSTTGEGVSGTSGVTGVHGTSTNGGYGVLGTSSGTLPAVYGSNQNNGNSIGVQGFTGAFGYGVVGGTKGGNPVASGGGVLGLSDNGYAVQGQAGAGFGVRGESDSGTGVYGQMGTGPLTKAVWGKHLANGYGVFGEATGNGAVGVHGTITNGNAGARGVEGNGGTQGYGVYGSSISGYGVYGTVNGGVGVGGAATSGTGVVGTGVNGVNGNTSSVGGYGGFFTTIANQSTAVGGQIFGSTSGSAAFVGAAAAGNYAAFFTGTVVVNGALVVSGGGKSAAVKHPRTGDYRALYCEESPESWFADYGKGKLVNGQAEVKLDADFAVLIHTEDYHVFLTPQADCNGLYVTNATASGFSVREVRGGTSSLSFSYRVVGKRSDLKLERLAKVTMPNIRLSDSPPAPPPAVPPPSGSDGAPQAQPPVRPSPSAVAVPGSTGARPQSPAQPLPPPRSG